MLQFKFSKGKRKGEKATHNRENTPKYHSQAHRPSSPPPAPLTCSSTERERRPPRGRWPHLTLLQWNTISTTLLSCRPPAPPPRCLKCPSSSWTSVAAGVAPSYLLFNRRGDPLNVVFAWASKSRVQWAHRPGLRKPHSVKVLAMGHARGCSRHRVQEKARTLWHRDW